MILRWLSRILGAPSSPTAPQPPAPKPPAPAIGAPSSPTAPQPTPAISSAAALDPRTERNISTLHPRVQPRAREFMVLATSIARQHGVVVKIISGLRSYSEQSALYAKGRTAPGPKVTNARAGFSNHNFGTAWDIGLFKGKRYLTDSPIYTEIGQAARSLGIVWGGDFKSFKDTPHYELPTGHTLAQMRQRVAAGKDIFA